MSAPRESLEFELEGYERSGKKDRADQVRAELAKLDEPEAQPEPVSVTDDPDTAQDDPDAVAKPKPRARKKS